MSTKTFFTSRPTCLRKEDVLQTMTTRSRLGRYATSRRSTFSYPVCFSRGEPFNRLCSTTRPDSRTLRARTAHAPRTQARDADREAQDLAPQVAPLARARGRGTDLASRRRVPRRRPLAVRLPGERGAARAPGGKSTRRSSRTRATGARSASTSRPLHRAQRRIPEPCGRSGGGVTAAAPGFVMPRSSLYVVRLMNAKFSNTIAQHGCDRSRVALLSCVSVQSTRARVCL